MKTPTDIPTLIQQIEARNDDLRLFTRPGQLKQVEKSVAFLCDDLCAAYLDASPEQRADICIAVEFRGPFLREMAKYYHQTAVQAARTAAKKNKEQAARDLIRQAAAANAIIGTRLPEYDLEESNRIIMETAAAVGFDLHPLAHDLEVPYKVFLQRALQYHKGKDRIRALKALGNALYLHPSLENNDRVLALAAVLTGKTEVSAMLTLSDRYILNKFVQEIEEAEIERRSRLEPKPRSTLDTIRSWFSQ
jgi:uncharacterized protein YbjQ (UPF0145 family)